MVTEGGALKWNSILRDHTQRIISEASENTLDQYHDSFRADASTNEDANLVEFDKLIYGITGMYYRPEEKENPFGPMMSGPRDRTMIPEDLTEDQLDLIKNLSVDISDIHLRTRILDLLWIRRRDHIAGKEAAKGYLSIAQDNFSQTRVFDFINYLERALQLTGYFGADNDVQNECIGFLEDKISDIQTDVEGLALAKLMELWHRYVRTSNKCETFAEIMAEAAEDRKLKQQYEHQRIYLEIGTKLYLTTQNEESVIALKEAIAKSFEEEAANREDSFLAKTVTLQKAIEAYRRIPNTGEKIKELHALLMKWQQKSMDEMQTFSTELDITKFVNQVRADIKNKSIPEIIRYLVLTPRIPSKDSLRKIVKQIIDEHPVQYLFQGRIINDDGKTLGTRPDIMSDDPEEVERAFRMEMHREAEFQRTSTVSVIINPVLEYIQSNFPVQKAVFLDAVQYSPFVPDGREEIFALGLYYGLMGNPIEASSLLIPQIENSIRYILEKNGTIVTSLDNYGVQKEFDLNRLLFMNEVNDFLGEDLTFELQGLLVENTSHNIRNAFAHGLIRQESFHSRIYKYLWWIILRLVMTPIYNYQERAKQAKDSIKDTDAKNDTNDRIEKE